MEQRDATQKRGRGRPAVGQQIPVKLPADLMARLDAFASTADAFPLTRSAAVRALLEASLSGGAIQAQMAALGASATAAVRTIQDAVAQAQQRMNKKS
jgi:hypothetical protein